MPAKCAKSANCGSCAGTIYRAPTPHCSTNFLYGGTFVRTFVPSFLGVGRRQTMMRRRSWYAPPGVLNARLLKSQTPKGVGMQSASARVRSKTSPTVYWGATKMQARRWRNGSPSPRSARLTAGISRSFAPHIASMWSGCRSPLSAKHRNYLPNRPTPNAEMSTALACPSAQSAANLPRNGPRCSPVAPMPVAR